MRLFNFSKIIIFSSYFLIAISNLVSGCAPSGEIIMREDAIAWIRSSEAVTLLGPSGDEMGHLRALIDQTLSVEVALSKPDSSRKYSDCQLAVYVNASAYQSDSVLSLSSDIVHLQIGENPDQLSATPESSIDLWAWPSPGAEAIICFDLDSTQVNSSPIVIYLDSVVVFNQQKFNLGRIELDSYMVDTARYIY